MNHKLTILHFNDVYNIEESKQLQLGGAARFATALHEHRNKDSENTLVLFSGDALSPSVLSMTSQGKHMIEVLNQFHIDCSVIGNHEFDFGIENTMECIEKSNFPWLNGNCFDELTKRPLCDLPQIMTIQKQIKIGLLGLVEPEWVDTLSMVDPDEVYVKDFCTTGRRLANQLRNDLGCDLVIALTHMRWENDIILASKVPEIDIVLGGHDHDHGLREVKAVNGETRWVIKSDTEFRYLGKIVLTVDANGAGCTNVECDFLRIDHSWQPDPKMEALVAKENAKFAKGLERVLGRIEVPLDGRFDMIRTQETNLGNFVTDVMLTAVEADCALLNSGSLRIDSIIPAGDFTLLQLNLIFPMLQSIVVVDVTGRDIIELLENGVSQVSSKCRTIRI